jgi:hypothetical protein
MRASSILSTDFQMTSKMNSAYFVTNLLAPLEQVTFPRGRAPHQKRLVIHLDNWSVHKSRASRDWLEEHYIHRMPQPPDSPDLALSDFHLFPTVKKIRTDSSGWRRQAFESLQAILRGIDREELNRVFQGWVRRVQEVSEGNGDYVGS